MNPKIQDALDALVSVIENETVGKAMVVTSLWLPTSKTPKENTRILVRNERGNEIFHTYSKATHTLFLKYKEWMYIPD